jgi:tocopherol cyclase
MLQNCTPHLSGKVNTLRPYHSPLRSVIYNQRKIFNPSWFQGNREKTKYFEGWYFKNVSSDSTSVWSFIPGISLVEGDNHSFVQVINGQTGETYYYRYPATEFLFSSKSFEVCVGGNYFSENRIVLDLNNGENSFKGELFYDDMTTYPTWLARPGIMGWYRYMPFMECYHGVVSLDHNINGSLLYNGKALNFNGGRGYIEKDWGSSMPESWIWMQTNHFNEPGTSFMLSVARIPWIRKTFTGFLGFLLHNKKLITFATWTGDTVTSLHHGDKEAWISVLGKKYLLEVHAVKQPKVGGNKGALKAPVFGKMERTIHESIDAEIEVTVTSVNGNTFFKGTGKHSGFEMVGDLDLLKF